MYNDDDFLEAGDWIPESEFQTALNDLIKEEVNRRIKETVEQLEQARKTLNTYTQRNNELIREKRELENNLKTALIEKEKEVKRDIFGGFNVGDYVFVADGKQKETVICPDCQNARKVRVIFNGKETDAQCPSCANRNYWETTIFEYKPRKMKVSQITFKVWNDGKCKESKAYLNHDFERDSKDIFLREEECQSKCDELNKKELEKQIKQINPSQ